MREPTEFVIVDDPAPPEPRTPPDVRRAAEFVPAARQYASSGADHVGSAVRLANHWPNYQCAVRPHVTYDVAGRARVTFKPNNRAPSKVKHGAANTHPGKRGKRKGYRHVRR